MILIGEKLNGSIPAVGAAIAARDSDFLRGRARAQAEAGAAYIDVCASVPEEIEVETLGYLIGLVQEVTGTPVCVDSPSPRSLVAAMPFCKKAGLLNSVSLEGDKIDVVFPAIRGTDWGCVALLCDDSGIPRSVERRIQVFVRLLERAEEYGILPERLYIDPLVTALSTSEDALDTFTACCKKIRALSPSVHITSGLSNISFGLPNRKSINQAFMALALAAGMDSAIADPTSRDLLGIVYATEALLGRDECCLDYIKAFRQGRIGPEK